MQKMTFIFCCALLLTVGLQINLFKNLGISPAFSLASPLLLVLVSLKNYLKSNIEDLFIYLLILWVTLKFLLIGGNYASDLLQALILTVIYNKFAMLINENNIKVVEWVVYISGGLGFIGFMQYLSVPIVSGIQPTMNSDFIGSGGFSGVSILRPNFGLGNSLNVGLFFILNIFLTATLSDFFDKKIFYAFVGVFIGCVVLTLSRTALLQLIVLAPLLIRMFGFSRIIVSTILIYVFTHDYINLFYLRLKGGHFTSGSFQERAEMFQNFLNSLELHGILVGTVSSDLPKITDGLLMNVYQSVGLVFTVVFLAATFRFHTFRLRSDLSLIVLITISILFTNSFFAFYNLFLIVVILRIREIQAKSPL